MHFTVTLILDACIQFESYLTKTVGGDKFKKKSLTDGRPDGQTDGRTTDTE